ncbi:MAG: response regulator [Spirochaetota bacterium]
MDVNDSLFKVIFEYSPVGMVVLGKEGNFIYSNAAFRGMLALNHEDLAAATFKQYLEPNDIEEFEEQFKSLIKREKKHFKHEARYLTKDGKTGWWSLNLATEYDPVLKKWFIIAIIDDKTLEKEGHEKLRIAKEFAERTTRIKSDFLANMSHEIRTPIHTIIGMNELLLETKLDVEQQEYAEQVRFSADVLLSLINDILDFSKIEAGKLNLETIDFDLFKMTEDAIDLVSLEAHKKGLEVVLFISSDVPHFVRGDPVRLRQVIINLFNNSVKFTGRGEIVVTARRVEDTPEFAKLIFTVKDTGIGIPKDKVTRLFQAFSQVDTSTTRKFGGTGLGLSISKNLAQMMKGEIGVESEYGKGSSFWFTTCLEKQTVESGTGLVSDWMKPDEAFVDTRVLMVDDNMTARSYIKSYLEEWHCKVDEAENGRQALEMLRKEAASGKGFTLCTIDLVMPGMDGWQLASEINADKTINSTRLILFSPTGKSGDEAKMKLLGWFDAYLSKPVKKSELFECLFRILHSEADLEAVEELANGAEEKEEKSKTTEGGLILIAEDHEVNQQLFRTILESLGYEVRVAGNGIEAVNAVEKEKFDLIFMDVQMPEMNGYEAAQKIRTKGVTTPIIAATASAIKSEMDKCLEVGMNDFLIKPFKKKDVLTLLDKWMKDDGTPRPGEVVKKEQAAEDLYIFDLEKAVETFMGKKDVVLKVLKAFVEKVENQIPVIAEAVLLGDMEKVRREAHSIKGGAWNLEVKKLGDKAAELESAGRENRPRDATRLFEELKTSFEEFLQYIKNIECLV